MYSINTNCNFFNEGKISELLLTFEHSYQKKIRSINVTCLSYGEMIEFNTKVLNHNYCTDIITFCSDKKNFIDVELFMCSDYIKNFCCEEKLNFDVELVRTFFHGLLHCVGFNDDTHENILLMREKENQLCEKYFSKFHVKH